MAKKERLNVKVAPYGIRKGVYLEFISICQNLGFQRSDALESMIEQFNTDMKQISKDMILINTKQCSRCTYKTLLGGFKTKIKECKKCRVKTLKQHILDQRMKISEMARILEIGQSHLTMQLNGNATMKPETRQMIIEILGIKEKNIKE